MTICNYFTAFSYDFFFFENGTWNVAQIQFIVSTCTCILWKFHFYLAIFPIWKHIYGYISYSSLGISDHIFERRPTWTGRPRPTPGRPGPACSCWPSFLYVINSANLPMGISRIPFIKSQLKSLCHHIAHIKRQSMPLTRMAWLPLLQRTHVKEWPRPGGLGLPVHVGHHGAGPHQAVVGPLTLLRSHPSLPDNHCKANRSQLPTQSNKWDYIPGSDSEWFQ